MSTKDIERVKDSMHRSRIVMGSEGWLSDMDADKEYVLALAAALLNGCSPEDLTCDNEASMRWVQRSAEYAPMALEWSAAEGGSRGEDAVVKKANITKDLEAWVEVVRTPNGVLVDTWFHGPDGIFGQRTDTSWNKSWIHSEGAERAVVRVLEKNIYELAEYVKTAPTKDALKRIRQAVPEWGLAMRVQGQRARNSEALQLLQRVVRELHPTIITDSGRVIQDSTSAVPQYLRIGKPVESFRDYWR